MLGQRLVLPIERSEKTIRVQIILFVREAAFAAVAASGRDEPLPLQYFIN
jgi:hypothetical protein